MTYKFHTRLDLINGGNIFRQDDKITLGYIARNANGEAIDFSGKEITGTIYNRRAGIMFEAEASFDAESQKIIFTITQTLDHGTFEIEFVVTDPGNANYRVVVPSDEYSGRLDIKPSSANIEVTGVRMVTVEQLRSEQQLAQSTYEKKVDGKVQQLETGFTNHKNAVGLVVEDVQQKASAAETATQTANDAASTANNAASSANIAATGASEQAGVAEQAASGATAASTAANSSADRANTAAENAEGIVDEFGTYKDSTAKSKTFGTVDERFEELETDSYMPAKNGLVNSDFSQGTLGWEGIDATFDVATKKATVTGDGSHRRATFYQRDVFNASDHYYYRGRMRALNSDIRALEIGSYTGSGYTRIINPLINQWYEISGVGSGFSDSAMRLNAEYDDGIQSLNSMHEVERPLVINLTQIFGAGNEPTKAEMDELLNLYPNNWFDGTVNLAENKKFVKFLMSQIRNKANKLQEAWITPTLLNGWTDFSASDVSCKYYKDNFGAVRIQGMLKGGVIGASNKIFDLPIGYRPPKNLWIPIVASGQFGVLVITASGTVYVQSGSVSNYISLGDEITFKA